MTFSITISREAFIVVDAEQLLQLKLNHARKLLKLSRKYSNYDEIELNKIALGEALQNVTEQFKKHPAIIKRAAQIAAEYSII